MQQKAIGSLWYFTAFFIAAMLLPRLVHQGLFGDGLLYSSMARNMANRKGSLWQPFFSSGYWLDNVKPIYYENPPLMLWLQSFFFRCLGEAWWVEKLYSFCLFLVNAFLLVRIWRFFENKLLSMSGFGCIVLLFWYSMPRVIWANPNNMMDNQQLTFCLLAIWFLLEGLHHKIRFQLIIYGILAGISIFFGILSKGPVALYPIAVPTFWAIFTNKISLKKGILYSFHSLFIAIILFSGLLFLNPSANHFFENYWQQRLLAVIEGSRTDMALNGWSRLETLQYLAIELLPMSILFLLGYSILKIKKISLQPTVAYNRIGWFFVAVGFSATLPIMFSTKQSAIYLLPGLPMFALAGAFFALPFLIKIIELFTPNFTTKFSYLSYLGLFITVIYTGSEAGNLGREKTLIRDISQLKKIIPANEKIGVCTEIMEDFVYHTYLQRFGNYELQKSNTTRFYLTKKAPFDSSKNTFPNPYSYKLVKFENQDLVLYERSQTIHLDK